MTDASHIDYGASYAHESRNDRTIQSIPALPGQHRLGRYGLATSRFFTRRSLLGSSASGLPPPAFTRAPETLPETHKPPGAGGRSRTTATGSRHGHTVSQVAPHRPIPRQASRSDAVRLQPHRSPQGHARQSASGHPTRSQMHPSSTSRRPGATQPAQYPEIQRLREKISRWQTTLEPPSLAPEGSLQRQGEPSDPRNFTSSDDDSSPEGHKDGVSTPNDSSSGEWVARKIEVIPTGMVAPAGSTPYVPIEQDDIERPSESGYSGRTASSTNSSRSTSQGHTRSSSSSSKGNSETAARSPQSTTQHSQPSRRTESPSLAQGVRRIQLDGQHVYDAGRTGISRHGQSNAHAVSDEHSRRGHASPNLPGHSNTHHIQPPPTARLREGMRLERIDTTYLTPGTETAPPPSAKPSLASLPRLSSSTQAPLRQGLRAFVSDEDSASSVRSRLSQATRSQPGHPQYPATAAAGGFARRQLSDVPEQMESGVSESEQPVRRIKTKYGENYERYDDRLPFEPPQSRRVPEDARGVPSFRDPKLADSDYADVYNFLHPGSHNSAQRPRTKQQPPAHPSAPQTVSTRQSQRTQPTSTTKYSFEERDDDEARRFAQSLAEARQELRSIFSENIQMTPPLESPSRPTTPGPSDQAARREIPKKVEETSDELYDRLQEQVGRKKEPLRLGYHQDATQLAKPKQPKHPVDDAAVIEDSEDDAHGGDVTKKRMMFRKPPTPYAAAIDSSSGDESATPSTHDQKPRDPNDHKVQERKKKRKSKRELVGVLKKQAEPTPRNTPAMSDIRKSVHFGGDIPADVGGNFSPPPHSSQESPSTQAGEEEIKRPRSSRPEERVRQDAIGPIVRSREPSPNPEEYEKYHAGLKKGKQRARESNDKGEVFAESPHDLPPPLPFDFSKFAGPSTGTLEFDTLGKDGGLLDEAGASKFDFTKARRDSKQTRVSEDDGSDEDTSPEPLRPRIRTPRQKLQLMPIPTVNNEYRKLPAQYLANGVILCKGLTVYPRLRELVWDFSSDLEDVNKRRDRYWVPLADACEKLLMKIQKSLHDQTTKRLLPLFRDILGQDEEPRENSIIFARRAVTAQIKQVWSFTADALSEYNDIVNGADEILDVAGAVENVSQQAKDGFRATYVGFIHMQEHFKHLFDEINEITHCIRNCFMYLHQVPSPSEMATFPHEQKEKLKNSRDDLVEWFDSLLKALRTWRAKVTYQNFEKQLSALRSLDRKWEEADDVQLGMIKALFCFGFCLPRSSRKAIAELQGKNLSEEKSKETPLVKTQQPRKQASMSYGTPKVRPDRRADLVDEQADIALPKKHTKTANLAGRTSQKTKKKNDSQSDSGSSELVLPDLRGRPRSVQQGGRGESLDSRYRDHPPTLSPADPQPPGGMADFLRQDPAFNALSDEEKLVVIRHMLEQAQQGG